MRIGITCYPTYGGGWAGTEMMRRVTLEGHSFWFL